MNDYHRISEGILGEETVEKTNTELFLSLVGQYFPEAIKDGEVDFTALKEEMGEFPQVSSEHYEFTWAGKQAAKKEAQADLFSRTLKYKPQDSLNPDTTENIYIEGDNLEALKLLRRNYHGKIKMIYIDPPYNTGKDFIYRDDFTLTDEELALLSGDIVDGERLQKITKDCAKFHTLWLNLLYTRLKVSRELLADDGIILVNMDEHEIVNLQRLLSEVFNEVNDLGTIVWDKRNPKGDAKGISYQHEYICVYAKNKAILTSKCKIQRPKKNADNILKKAAQLFSRISDSYTLDNANKDFRNWIKQQTDFSGGEKAYCNIDENGDVYRPVSMSWPNKKKAPDEYFIPLIHPITHKPCPVPERGWRNPPSTMEQMIRENRIIFGVDETTIPNSKYLLKDNMFENIPSLLYYGGSDTDLLAQMDIPFDTPKVVDICAEHIKAFTTKDDIILDFFSGSATIAHAIMKQNSEDGMKRRFILVQLDEHTYKKDKDGNEVAKEEYVSAYNAGYRNICEVGKERIRRAAQMIHEENPDAKFDDGFKVFEVSDTNIKWNTVDDDEVLTLADMDSSIPDKDRIDFTKGYTDIDVVYEVMLRQFDIPLSTPIEKLSSVSDRTYIFADAVVVCLEPDIDEKLIERLAAIEPTPAKYVLRDSAFNDDIELKDVSFRRLSALIANHQTEEERKSKYNNYTVEFI